MADGTVIFSRNPVVRHSLAVDPRGKIDVIAKLGEGPNGWRVGLTVMNICLPYGGLFVWTETDGHRRPIGTPRTIKGRSIQRVDPSNGSFRNDLMRGCEGS